MKMLAMLAVLGTLMVPTVPCVARKRCAVLAFAVYRATRPKVAHCLLFLLAGRGAPELTTSSLPRRLGLVQLSAIEPAHFTAAWCFLAPPTHHTDHFLSVLSACVKPQASIVTWHSTGHICSRPGLAVSSAMMPTRCAAVRRFSAPPTHHTYHFLSDFWRVRTLSRVELRWRSPRQRGVAPSS